MIKLDGKVVIITGGGRGIGFGLSTAFAKAGARVERNPPSFRQRKALKRITAWKY